MAKYEVTYRCGHTGVEELYGPNKDRESRIVWMGRSKDCPDCAAAQRAEEAAKLADTAQAAGLPALTGSPKQITWAESIRREKLDELHVDLAHYEKVCAVPAKLDIARRALAHIENKASAAWWIDRRSSPIKSLLRDALDAISA